MPGPPAPGPPRQPGPPRAKSRPGSAANSGARSSQESASGPVSSPGQSSAPDPRRPRRPPENIPTTTIVSNSMTVSTPLRAIPQDCPRANVSLHRPNHRSTTAYITEISGMSLPVEAPCPACRLRHPPIPICHLRHRQPPISVVGVTDRRNRVVGVADSGGLPPAVPGSPASGPHGGERSARGYTCGRTWEASSSRWSRSARSRICR
jgi:hypothetical protein